MKLSGWILAVTIGCMAACSVHANCGHRDPVDSCVGVHQMRCNSVYETNGNKRCAISHPSGRCAASTQKC